MIRHDPHILEQADIEGRTALMWAAGKGANGVIQLLLGLSSSAEESQEKVAPGERDLYCVELNIESNLHYAAVGRRSEWRGPFLRLRAWAT